MVETSWKTLKQMDYWKQFFKDCVFLGPDLLKRASTDQETDGNLVTVLVLLQNIRTLHLLFIHVAIATHFLEHPMTSSLDLAVSLSRAKRDPVSLFQRKANHISNMPIIQTGHLVVRLRCYACHLAWGIAVVNLSLCRASTRQGLTAEGRVEIGVAFS